MKTGGAEIHDLGYARYTGPRSKTSRRFLAIARNVFGVAWKSGWASKAPIIMSIITVVAAAVIMYTLRMKLADMARGRGAPIPRADEIVYMVISILEVPAFLLATIVCCVTVANDLRMGAFQFYFSRPIRPRDYVAGKLLGCTLIVGIPMLAGPVFLAIMRLVFADSPAEAVDLSPILLKALALGLCGTAAFVLVPLGFGAFLARRQPAQALWAVYFLLVSPAAMGFARFLRFPWLAVAAVQRDVQILGKAIFHVQLDPWDPPPWGAGVGLGVICVAAVLVIWSRVRAAETAGLGSG